MVAGALAGLAVWSGGSVAAAPVTEAAVINVTVYVDLSKPACRTATSPGSYATGTTAMYSTYLGVVGGRYEYRVTLDIRHGYFQTATFDKICSLSFSPYSRVSTTHVRVPVNAYTDQKHFYG